MKLIRRSLFVSGGFVISEGSVDLKVVVPGRGLKKLSGWQTWLPKNFPGGEPKSQENDITQIGTGNVFTI